MGASTRTIRSTTREDEYGYEDDYDYEDEDEDEDEDGYGDEGRERGLGRSMPADVHGRFRR
jgi:hypothetical protein